MTTVENADEKVFGPDERAEMAALERAECDAQKAAAQAGLEFLEGILDEWPLRDRGEIMLHMAGPALRDLRKKVEAWKDTKAAVNKRLSDLFELKRKRMAAPR